MSNFHGSDIEKVANAYQINPEALINFGVNANPLGLSARSQKALAQQIELFGSYPDPDYAQLRHAISQYLSVDFSHILPANGTSELIHQIIQHFSPKKAVLYTPTYSEYAREVKKQGGEVLKLELTKENQFQFPADSFAQMLEDADLVLLCNPNNPTATLLSAEDLLPLLEKAGDIPFVIDETYIEFTDLPQSYSGVSLIHRFSNLIILRSFSKFFAAPGLRLGYAILSNSSLLHELQNSYPWNIHSLAAAAGEIFLTDREYISASRAYIQEERKRILAFLAGLPDLTVYPSNINFFLLELHRHSATELFLFLLRQGMLLRNFHDEIGSGFFRFCILDRQSNQRLLDGIADFIKNHSPE